MIEFLCLRMNNDRPKESPKVKQTDAFDDNRSNEKRRNSHISNLIFSTSTLYVYSKWIREAIAIKFAKRYASFATFGSMSQESMCCTSCFTPTTSVMLLQQQRSFFLVYMCAHAAQLQIAWNSNFNHLRLDTFFLLWLLCAFIKIGRQQQIAKRDVYIIKYIFTVNNRQSHKHTQQLYTFSIDLVKRKSDTHTHIHIYMVFLNVFYTIDVSSNEAIQANSISGVIHTH